MSIVLLSSIVQLNEILDRNRFVLVYIHTDRCYYCDLMNPVVNGAAADVNTFGNIKFCAVNVSSHNSERREVLVKYDIQGYPHTLVFRQGDLFCRIPGYLNSKKFRDIVLFSLDFNSSTFYSHFMTPNRADEKDSDRVAMSGDADEGTECAKFIQIYDGCKNPFIIKPRYHKHNVHVFCTSDAPYTPHLIDYISRTAAAFKNELLIHIFKMEGPFTREIPEFIASRLLNYRPFASMSRKGAFFSNYSFHLDASGTIDFGSWIRGCLESSRILESVPKTKRSRVEEFFTMEDFHTKISVEDKLVVVLFHDSDSTAGSVAMKSVFEAISEAEELKELLFFQANYDMLPDVTAASGLEIGEGPVFVVFFGKSVVNETRTVMPFEDLKGWLLHCIIDFIKTRTPQVSRGTGKLESQLAIGTPSKNELPFSISTSSLGSFHGKPKGHMISQEGKNRTVRRSRSMPALNPCHGNYQSREERNYFSRMFANPPAFLDPEYACVIVPDIACNGLQLGRGNEGASHFNVTLQPQRFENLLKICFAVQFSPDRTENARFVSGRLSITFGYTAEDRTERGLIIRHVYPKSQRGVATTVQKGTSVEKEATIGAEGGPVSGNVTVKTTKQTSFFRETAPEVEGTGERTDTATWTFVEDLGEAGRKGLYSEYNLESTLAATSKPLQEIWMTFWGKAVLVFEDKVGPARKQIVKIGSQLKQYKRILDLKAHGIYSWEDDEDDEESTLAGFD